MALPLHRMRLDVVVQQFDAMQLPQPLQVGRVFRQPRQPNPSVLPPLLGRVLVRKLDQRVDGLVVAEERQRPRNLPSDVRHAQRGVGRSGRKVRPWQPGQLNLI